MREGEKHKVRTYKEYHSVCPSSELGLSPNPFLASECSPPPQKQGGGGTLARGWGVGGSPNSDEGHTLWYSLYVRTLWGKGKCRGHARRGWASKLEGIRSHSHIIFYLIFLYYKQTFVKEN
jgi:hypothetical protein